jgi:putative transcriptional regulator
VGGLRRPTSEEIRKRRAELAERVRNGTLALPGAVGEMRHALGLSQEEFAGMVRLTRRQLAEIERGEANPTVETLRRIGSAFGLDVGFVARAPQPRFVRRRPVKRSSTMKTASVPLEDDDLTGPGF